jgi:prophage regulatory protein
MLQHVSAMIHVIRRGTDMADKHLRRPAVQELTGLSRSTIYDLMAKGDFPRPVHLTAKAVGWPESKIVEWLAQRQTT